jgi:hypothetical protein
VPPHQLSARDRAGIERVFSLFPNAESNRIVRMSDDDFIKLAEDVKKLADRVGVLETDMLNVIATFQKLRAFAHVL